MNDDGIEVYRALSKIIKVRFSKELKNSGIQLLGLYHINNLVTNKTFYLVEVNRVNFRFADEKAFTVIFIQFLSKSIIKLQKRYKELLESQDNEFVDEVRVESEYKKIDFYIFKQKQLLNKSINYRNNW